MIAQSDRRSIVVGQTASCELSGKSAPDETYYSRLALGRAEAVSRWLTDGIRLKRQPVLLTSGPHMLPATRADQHARNRSVEVRAYWPIRSEGQPVSMAANSAWWEMKSDVLQPPEMLTLLGLVVALSAYLAAVGVYLRERVETLRTATTAEDKFRRIKIKTRLSLLTIDHHNVAAATVSRANLLRSHSPNLRNRLLL